MLKNILVNWLVKELRSSLVFNDLLNSKILEFYKHKTLSQYRVWGDENRISLGENVQINDALINTVSGDVKIGDFSFFGHGVSLLTGTHNISKNEGERQISVPTQGRDIIIGRGVWIASHAIVLGPCEIGDNAVIGAGALVTGKIKANTLCTQSINIDIKNLEIKQ